VRATISKLIIPLVGVNLIAAAVGFEALLHRPVNGGNPGPAPLIVMDDFHDLQVGLVLFQGYGPSRYSGGFTRLGFEGHTLWTVPLSGYTVLLLFVGTVTLVVGIGRKCLQHEWKSG
jgi:hypothetical protein